MNPDETHSAFLGLSKPEASPLSALHAKCAKRILPLLFVCFVVSFLDRINIGFAQLQMRDDLGFDEVVYGLGAGIFFLGYFAFEIPSNLILRRIGARLTFSRIMVCWGVVSACTAWVTLPWHLYLMRFLLGSFEAGFFPGIILYLGYWFPASRRAGVVSWMFVAVTLAGILGGVLSSVIVQHLGGVAGLAGWQWMFVLEGLPAVMLGVVTFCYLDDGPATATWLTRDEKSLLQEALADDLRRSSAPSNSFRVALSDLRLYLLASVYFGLVCGTMAIAFWLPILVRDIAKASLANVGLLTAIPYAVGTLGIVLLSRSSDRWQERRYHYLLCTLSGGAALSVLPMVDGNAITVVCLLSVAVAMTFAALPIFWSVPQQYLVGDGAAGGIAVVSSLGQLGSFLSPAMVGWLNRTTGRPDAGLYALAAFMMVSGVLMYGALSAGRSHRGRPDRSMS